MIGNQRINQFVQIAFHNPVELVERQIDAMIGNTSLREIISADTLGSIARTDLATARFRAFGFCLLALHVVKACPENLHGAGAVLVLGFFSLNDHDAGRDVRNANRRIGRVHVLATGARCPHRIDADILITDLNVNILGFGQNRDGCRRCMDAPAGFRFRHTLHAVHA